MPEFKISVASPPDREKLVAMIDYGNEQWVELNQEREKLVVEFYPRVDGKPWTFDLEEAMAALTQARVRLVGENG